MCALQLQIYRYQLCNRYNFFCNIKPLSLSLQNSKYPFKKSAVECPFYSKLNSMTCEKVASDLGLGSDFCQVLRFPPLFTTG